MNSRYMRIFASLLIIPMLIGCATIVGKGGPEALNIRSTPDQATITITDEGGKKIFEGKTPTVVSLEKKKGYFSGKKYTIKISKDGFADHSAVVDTTPGGWYLAGNLVFGFVIGWFVVDPLTGAMWTLDTKEVNANLEAGKKADNDLKIVLLEDVPLSLRDKMVKVSQ